MKFQNYKIFREEVNKGPTAAVFLLLPNMGMTPASRVE